MSLVRVSTKGQIVIPKKIRESLGIKPNGCAYLERVKDYAVIRPIPDPVKGLRGTLKDAPSMTKALVEEHRLEVKRDENLSP
ncbi:MAG: AbrB/MazE/SpoVT family DNA-binding domain-containing protein [bacterium]